MDQYWKFVTRREERKPHGGNGCAFLERKQGFLVRSITAPYHSLELQRHLERLSSTPPAINNKGLLSLPDELLLDIVDSVPEIEWEDVVILAVTCQRLFYLLRKLIDQGRAQLSAPWGGGRILCVGGYAQYEDLPATLLEAGERAIIEKAIGKYPGEDPGCGGLDSLLDGKKCFTFRGAFTYCEWADFLRRFKSDADRKTFKMVASVTFPPERTDWVLLNMVKNEYVRASALAELARKPNDQQPFLPHCRLDLGHALLTRICWSSVELPNTPPKMKMHRGAWVGDRFCITTMDHLCGSDPEWEGKDVSKEVVRDLVAVCRKMFGKEWLAQVEGDVLDSEEDYLQNYWFGSDGHDELASACREIGSPWPIKLSPVLYMW
ncbi:hypothetical protein K466DRAFT_206632 [Polyporus arcularius HHB13444]|uniref:F-box domain-containing protein n=1 Tax=Polyporus arcularius HHB13444 TaxID=1314778 RepID=A0A5C3Q2N6_9APHY|nr:hypothetical protein K466DRAFT_206632 [Polyporus arcularius HHB13444]